MRLSHKRLGACRATVSIGLAPDRAHDHHLSRPLLAHAGRLQKAGDENIREIITSSEFVPKDCEDATRRFVGKIQLQDCLGRGGDQLLQGYLVTVIEEEEATATAMRDDARSMLY